MFYKKQKMIEELEAANSYLRESNDILRRENEKYEKQLAGEHVGYVYCSRCEHGVARPYEGYVCLLECKCKDFRKKPE